MTYHGDNAEQRGSGKQIMSDQDNDGGGLPNTGIVTKTRPKTKKPSMYKVLLLNDDYTPWNSLSMCLNGSLKRAGKRRPRSCFRSTERGRNLWGFHLRDRGNQGQPGHGSGAAKSASAAVHVREGGNMPHVTLKKAYIVRWHMPLSGVMNMQRWNIFCCH